MADLFDFGKIGSIADIRKRAPVTIKVDDNILQGIYHLLTQQASGASDVQIDKSFGEEIYITQFGQKLMPMTLVCIALPPELCPDALPQQGNGVTEESLAKLYNNRHAGRVRPGGAVTRITVISDKVTFEGILVSINQVPHQLSDGFNYDVFRYTLTIQGTYI